MIVFILYIFTLLEDKILLHFLLYMDNISGHANNIKYYPKSIIEEINSSMSKACYNILYT